MRLFKNIPDRDRRLLFPVLVVLGFLSILLFVDIPLYKRGMELDRKAGEEEKRLKAIISMGEEYLSLRDEVEYIRERAFSGGGASISEIDSVVSRSGFKKRLSSLKPATTPAALGLRRVRAELSFDRVALDDISKLMAVIGSGGRPAAVERLSIKAAYEDPSLFNAILVVNTVEKD